MGRKINYGFLLKLTKDISPNLDRKKKKESVSKEMREIISDRDKYVCQLCTHEDKENAYGNPQWDIIGSLHIHHIIPNGKATKSNLITLCDKCHRTVHLLLYLDNKWRWIPK